MSLQNLVRQRYAIPRELFLVYDKMAQEQGFSDNEDLQVVMGHFRYGYHRFSSRPARYFTFVRNPLDHLLSTYHYTFDHPEKFPALPAETPGLMEFASGNYGNNLQMRFISGIDDITGRENEVLEKAKENLRTKFEFIGLTEEFDASLLMLSGKLEWKNFFYKKANEGKTRKKIKQPTAEDLVKIKELNRYDEQLYQYAKELFEKQKRDYSSLSFRTKMFRFKNNWFWKLNPFYIGVKKLFGLHKTRLFPK